jgi:MFS family permease
MNKIVFFQIFNGLSAGIYSILIMLYLSDYIDVGLGDIYLFHYAIYYLVGNLTLSIFLIPGGLFADKFGRKPALVFGALLLAINGFIPPFATQWWQLLPASAINGVGTALYNPAQASLIADISSGYRREKSYSAAYFTNIGFTAIGLVIFSTYASIFHASVSTLEYYQLMLIVSAILGLGAVLPIALLRKPQIIAREKCDDPATQRMTIQQEELCGVPSRLKRNGVVIRLLAINLLVGLGAGFIIPVFTYYWKNVFSLSDATVTNIQVVGYIGLVAGSMLTPWLAKHAKVLGGRVGTIVVFQGVSILCAAYLAIAPLQGILYLAITAYVGRLVLMNAISPLTSALLMDHSPSGKRGLYSSLISIAFNVPNCVSPIFTYFYYIGAQPPYGFTYPISILVLLYSLADIIYVTTRKADISMLKAQKRLVENRPRI